MPDASGPAPGAWRLAPVRTQPTRRFCEESGNGFQEPRREPWQMMAADLDVSLRRAVRRLATGVAVVTVWHGDDVHGTTVSSVFSVSREPLLIGVCLRLVSGLAEVIDQARCFAVNVLSTRQSAVADW